MVVLICGVADITPWFDQHYAWFSLHYILHGLAYIMHGLVDITNVLTNIMHCVWGDKILLPNTHFWLSKVKKAFFR